jgi:hypothetical protein
MHKEGNNIYNLNLSFMHKGQTNIITTSHLQLIHGFLKTSPKDCLYA